MIALLAVLQAPIPSTPMVSRLYIEAHLNRYGETGAGGLADREGRVALIRRLGFEGVRLGFEWEQIEPSRGTLRWARVDSMLAALDSAGLRAYGLLLFTPKWAHPDGAPMSHRPVVGGSSAAGDTAFAAFAAAAARRYRGSIDRWEVWNEPNVPGFWVHIVDGHNAGPDARDYLTLYRLARDSIRAANPDAQVAVAGLASGEGSYRQLPDPTAPQRKLTLIPAYAYLAELMTLGLRTDFVGLHPYSDIAPEERRPGSRTTEFPGMVLDSVEAVLDAAGLTKTRLWVTEWGVNQTPGRTDDVVRPWFRKGIAKLMCDPRVAFVTIYTLGDADHHDPFALVTTENRLTAAGIALANYGQAPTPCP